jgi:hypothetical protein
MRTILHDILFTCPELVQLAFPGLWRNVSGAFESNLLTDYTQIVRTSDLTHDEVRKAWDRIFTETDVLDSYRFCFFLDALDEHEDSHQMDHRALVDELKRWVRSSPGAIKICASSREDNVFQTGFSADRRIRMQDLTKSDMQLYIRGMLENWDHMRPRSDIVDQIVDRSDGIFLWVTLVVKKLRECLEDGESLEQFSRDLERLPRDLEPLFEHLLEAIHKAGRLKKAWQMFKLVGVLNTSLHHRTVSTISRIPIVSYLFLDCLDANPDFAVLWSEQKLQKMLSNHQDQNSVSLEALQSQAQKLIQAWCKGLVEVRDFDIRGRPGDHTEVEELCKTKYALFTHRSIPEFLESRKTGIEAEDAEGNFANTMSQLLLATLKCTTRDYIPYVWWAHLIGVVVRVHYDLGQDMSVLRFLTHLEAEVYKHLSPCDPPIADNTAIRYSSLFQTADLHFCVVWSMLRDCITGLHSPFSKGGVNSVVASPVALVADSWHPEHIDHLLSQDATLLETEDRRALILFLLARRVLICSPSKIDTVPKLADRIERKLLSRPIPRQVNTLWSVIVLQYVASGFRPDEKYPDQLDGAGILIAAFLRAYGKPLLSTTVSQVSAPAEEQDSGVKTKPHRKVESIYVVELQDNDNEQFSAIRQDIRLDGLLKQSVAPNAHPFPPLDTTWTLRSLIERFNFRKRNEVLRLMDEIEGVPYTFSSLGCYTTAICGETGCEKAEHTVPWYPPGTIDPNAMTEAVEEHPQLLQATRLEHCNSLPNLLTYPGFFKLSPFLGMLPNLLLERVQTLNDVVLLLAVVLRLAHCAVTTSC